MMRYPSIEDLPMVCHYHLPEAALRVYQQAYNEAWELTATPNRDRVALHSAWSAVREQFMKDSLTGRWVQRRQ